MLAGLDPKDYMTLKGVYGLYHVGIMMGPGYLYGSFGPEEKRTDSSACALALDTHCRRSRRGRLARTVFSE